ncbi:CxxC motif-containing protein (DUF1111 family) [Dysgonomonadaceae bacterium PH5-43]|nr:CxxC motif-containing protein (DUF1111 family) [Dysgonomonadaceae bacterium PH5-43]
MNIKDFCVIHRKINYVAKRINKLYYTACFMCFCIVLFFSSCNEDNVIENQIINTSTGEYASYEELSAGTATIFSTSRYAYDTPASWVTGDLYTRFLKGDLLYDDRRIPEVNDFNMGGLGPVYVGFSCGSCHNNAGRTSSTLWTDGGSGKTGFSSCLVYITRKDGGFMRNYGRVLHDQTSIIGVEPEGKLVAEYTYERYSFPDGEEYELATPHYRITEWYADSLKAEDLIVSVRVPLRHVGMGQMMALDLEELKRLEAQSNYPEYGISGRLNYIVERGVKQIGISGNKSQHADLTIELGFSSDLGVTNDRYPEEVSQNQDQYNQTFPNGHHGMQITSEEMEDVDLYMHALGVPARRNVFNAVIKKGEENFYAAKCQLCHTPTLHTRTSRVALINGTELPWLSGQVIHPYSDFLLHDMGQELNDHYPSGLAAGYEWRTTPLWGLGLQETVNGHTQFLHDGRARNLTEAIMWHGGEGAVSRELFRKMSKEDRDALLAFLRSL